ncbi:pikachurin-like [Cotesia glomerata]|nr:pikachurin-like [Cotesia glomerata]XP_044575811.1 pikachurin-like [Cotesia glomerata]XP_044575812.1 pikachurin-like [Cotesia glomerata]XP_044575813.1 pikachurin-like [Cotesia glomerata]XP_044575814.1 pikachurin-like [Cotesia glomerata]
MAVKQCYYFIVILGLAAVAISQNPIDERTTFEAAFQGRCGHNSPCEQLCYELHDGMYECDCRDGFILHKNGYSCAKLNSTSPSTADLADSFDDNNDSDEESEITIDGKENIYYMPGSLFTIRLDSLREKLNLTDIKSPQDLSNEIPNDPIRFPTSESPNLEQKLPVTTESVVTTEPACSLDCGAAGNCYIEQFRSDEENGDVTRIDDTRPRRSSYKQRCQCPLGRTGDRCQNEAEVKSPRFTGHGWLAFPALKAAYKHIQLDLEFRPEAWDGILILTGERDDLQGDFMALILHHGFIEFRFDCGSGVGIVRSAETVKLNEWNTLNVYRHRWDAWIQLNGGKRVQGRSKGLFSRITFQEPLFVGGPGNTTGLDRLPVRTGFKGCIRHLEANEHRYRFPLAPQGDAANGFDVEECTADRCSKVPCSHGGKCLTTGGDTAVCLCPLGYTGDLCETRVDLQVPSFNGSSYLRYPGLGDSSLSWLELSVTLKPMTQDGVILYNGHHSDATGDFIALYLSSGHVQFTFDLGTGPATLRSESPVQLGEWLEIRVSRTGRLASLEVENEPAQEILAPGAFTQLSLPLNLYLGGAPSPEMFTPKMKTAASFVGCIQTVVLNHREVGILAEALGGVNVGNCGHACEARPCGDAECRPLRERFTCRCHPGTPHPCPAPEEFISSPPEPSFPSLPSTSVSMLLTKFERSVPSFTGTDSYLHYSDADTMKRIISYRVDINMRFRTSSSNGLLLWSGRQSDPQEQRDENEDFLALGLNQGYLTLAYNLGSGEAVLRYNLTRLDDDLWHRIRAVRNEQWASLVVDSGTGVSASSPGQLRELNTDTGLYIGGAPDVVRTTDGRYTRGIVGCISDLVLDSDFSVVLSSPEQATNTHSCIP